LYHGGDPVTGDPKALTEALREEGVFIGSPDKREVLALDLSTADMTDEDVHLLAEYSRASTKRNTSQDEFAAVKLLTWLLRAENRRQALEDLRIFRAAQERRRARTRHQENAPQLGKEWAPAADLRMWAYYQHTYENRTLAALAEESGRPEDEIDQILTEARRIFSDQQHKEADSETEHRPGHRDPPLE
jgi:hypothetical protein